MSAASSAIQFASPFRISDVSENNLVGLVRNVATGNLWVLFRNAAASVPSSFAFAHDGVMRSVVATYDGSRTPKVIVYVNGVSVTVTNQPTNTTIGSGQTFCDIGRDSPYSYTGTMAEMAVYNRVVTEAEALMHTAGCTTNHFPRGRIFCAPLIREVHDVVGGLTGTITGTTVSDHPRIYA
jgi:hypothetical protein